MNSHDISLRNINLKLKYMNKQLYIEKNLLKIIPLVDHKIIIETLTRCGIINRSKNIIFPTCYFYKIDDNYYLVHFKQLFYLTRNDGYDNISQLDLDRRNAIGYCLRNWKLIDVNDEKINERCKFIDIIPFSEKHNYTIQHKFNVNNIHQVSDHAGTRRPS